MGEKNDLISQFKLTAKVMLKFHSTKRFANFFQRFFSHPTTTNRRGVAKTATPRFALKGPEKTALYSDWGQWDLWAEWALYSR